MDTEALLEQIGDATQHAARLRLAAENTDEEVVGPMAQATLSVSYQLASLTAVLVAGIAARETSRVDRPEIADGWYRIELMGHRRRHGHVSTATLSGRQMVEIRQPVGRVDAAGDLVAVDTVVEHYSAAAIFSLSPSSEGRRGRRGTPARGHSVLMAAQRPTAKSAERAAELLGLKVSDLGAALRWQARGRLRFEANRVGTSGVRPSMRLANDLLAAAEACEESGR
jgi:hypothetical protein